MAKFYFTFGSDTKYPYGIGEYILIEAPNIYTAQRAFQAVHPNRPGSDCYNYSFEYNETEWKEIKDKYYKGVHPIEFFTADSVLQENEYEIEKER